MTVFVLVPVDGFLPREFNAAAYTTRDAAEAALVVANEQHTDRPRRIVEYVAKENNGG